MLTPLTVNLVDIVLRFSILQSVSGIQKLYWGWLSSFVLAKGGDCRSHTRSIGQGRTCQQNRLLSAVAFSRCRHREYGSQIL